MFKLRGAARWIGPLICLALIVLVVTATAESTPKRLKLGHLYSKESQHQAAIDFFVKKAREQTASLIEMEVAQGASASEEQLWKLMQAGKLDIVLVQTALAQTVDLFKLFELPYLVQDRKHMQFLVDRLILPEMSLSARKLGLEILGVFDGGFRQIASRRPIVQPNDLRGLRIRTESAEPIGTFFRDLGALPVSIAANEVQSALQASLFDAVDAPLSAIAADKSLDSLKHVLITNHAYTPIFIVANKAALEKLNPMTQSDLRVAAKKASWLSFAQAEERDLQMITKLTSAGTAITQLTEVERQPFIEISRRSYDSFATVSKDRVDLIGRLLRLVPIM